MKDKYTITPIPALKDNYIWAITIPNQSSCVIVDPGESNPVESFLNNNQYNLTDILVTHHHYDHTDGIEMLKDKYKCRVWGSINSKCSHVDKFVRDKDIIYIPKLDLKLTTIETPGHTLDHVVFFNDQMAFTGDTLFLGGMGKIFEGSAKQMFESLQKITKINKTTKVYCGHEYTMPNLEFAILVEPENEYIIKRLAKVRGLRKNNKVTIPATLKEELLTNPFLRTDNKNIISNVISNNYSQTTDRTDILAGIRKWKDLQIQLDSPDQKC